MLSFSFRSEPGEFLRASKDLGRFAPGKSREYLKLVITLLVLVAALLWLNRSEGAFPWRSLLAPVLLLAVVIGGVLVANRLRAGRMGVDVRDQVRLLTESGLEVRNVRVTQIPWSAMPSARESEEFFLFYVANTRGHYLPKRAVRSSEDLEAIRSLLRTQLGPRFVERQSIGAA